jgi:hypothetical protein
LKVAHAVAAADFPGVLHDVADDEVNPAGRFIKEAIFALSVVSVGIAVSTATK